MIDEKEVLKILKRYEGRMNPTAYFSLEADIVNIEQYAEPKTGHWIDDTKYGGTECSECGKWYPHATIAKSEIKYCSECGAKMVEP